MRIFQESNISTSACIKMVITPLVINFFMKPAPLDSAHTELSMLKTHFLYMKYPEWSLFSEQVTIGFSLTYAEGTHSNYLLDHQGISDISLSSPTPSYSDLGERNYSCDSVCMI